MTGQQPTSDTCLLVLVEDSPDEAELFCEVVAAENLQVPVKHFPDGQTALDYLIDHQQSATSTPCLVLLDLNLPKLDGKEVLRRMNANNWDDSIRVVVFSGSENPQDKTDCLTCGAHGFYVKPWRFEQYFEFIRGPLQQELRVVCPDIQQHR